MQEETKITSIVPEQLKEEEVNTAETVNEEPVDEIPSKEDEREPVVANPKEIIDPNENLYSQESLKNIERTLKNISGMMKAVDQVWMQTQKDLSINEGHIKELYKWNEDHKTLMPENLSEEEKKNFDFYNGLNSLTDEEITRIFGEGHPVFGVDTQHTIDRIKGAFSDFVDWISIRREYTQVHNAYLQLLEEGEAKEIEKLKELIKSEEDEEKKSKMQASVDKYYDQKYLRFLCNEDIPKKTMDKILDVCKNENKAQYIVNRAMDKLKKLNVSSKFILELGQFEKRFLPPRYKNNSNVLVSYFMNQLVYNCNLDNPKDEGKVRIMCMVFGLDRIVQNIADPLVREITMANIRAFEDKFLEFFPKVEEEPETLPEASDEEKVSEGTGEPMNGIEAKVGEEAVLEVKDYIDPFTINMDDAPEVYLIYVQSEESPVTQILKKAENDIEVTVGEETKTISLKELLDTCDQFDYKMTVKSIEYNIVGCQSMTYEEYSHDPSSLDLYKSALDVLHKEMINSDVEIDFVGYTQNGARVKSDQVFTHKFREWCTIPLYDASTGECYYLKAAEIVNIPADVRSKLCRIFFNINTAYSIKDVRVVPKED